MNRTQLELYATAQFAPLIAATFGAPGGVADPAIFSPVVDAALRAQGVADSDLATYLTDDTSATQNGDTLALVDYFALRLLWRQLATRVAVTVGPTQHQYQQQFANTAALLKDAEREIEHRGYGPDALQLGRLQLDLFEPREDQGYGIGGWYYGW